MGAFYYNTSQQVSAYVPVSSHGAGRCAVTHGSVAQPRGALMKAPLLKWPAITRAGSPPEKLLNPAVSLS